MVTMFRRETGSPNDRKTKWCPEGPGPAPGGGSAGTTGLAVQLSLKVQRVTDCPLQEFG